MEKMGLGLILFLMYIERVGGGGLPPSLWVNRLTTGQNGSLQRRELGISIHIYQAQINQNIRIEVMRLGTYKDIRGYQRIAMENNGD